MSPNNYDSSSIKTVTGHRAVRLLLGEALKGAASIDIWGDLQVLLEEVGYDARQFCVRIAKQRIFVRQIVEGDFLSGISNPPWAIRQMRRVESRAHATVPQTSKVVLIFEDRVLHFILGVQVIGICICSRRNAHDERIRFNMLWL